MDIGTVRFRVEERCYKIGKKHKTVLIMKNAFL